MSTDFNKAMKRSAALNNATQSIRAETDLPAQVFTEGWSSFLFFDSDRMFAPSFVEIVEDLMSKDQASLSCLLNLSKRRLFTDVSAQAIFFDGDMSTISYAAQLKQGGPPHGWIYQMDKYACASDKGEWIIYCEKRNDLAIIAFSGSRQSAEFGSSIKALCAEPIASFLEEFPLDALSDGWRTGLLNNYSTLS